MLSEEVRTQLEQVQQRLNLVREEVVENSISREKESFNARRAQVTTHTQKTFESFKQCINIKGKTWSKHTITPVGDNFEVAKTYWNILRIMKFNVFSVAVIHGQHIRLTKQSAEMQIVVNTGRTDYSYLAVIRLMG